VLRCYGVVYYCQHRYATFVRMVFACRTVQHATRDMTLRTRGKRTLLSPLFSHYSPAAFYTANACQFATPYRSLIPAALRLVYRTYQTMAFHETRGVPFRYMPLFALAAFALRTLRVRNFLHYLSVTSLREPVDASSTCSQPPGHQQRQLS